MILQEFKNRLLLATFAIFTLLVTTITIGHASISHLNRQLPLENTGIGGAHGQKIQILLEKMAQDGFSFESLEELEEFAESDISIEEQIALFDLIGEFFRGAFEGATERDPERVVRDLGESAGRGAREAIDNFGANRSHQAREIMRQNMEAGKTREQREQEERDRLKEINRKLEARGTVQG